METVFQEVNATSGTVAVWYDGTLKGHVLIDASGVPAPVTEPAPPLGESSKLWPAIVEGAREAMEEESSRAPQQNLTLAEESLRRGAEAAAIASPAWLLVFTCVVATAVGATYDVPRSALWNSGGLVRQPIIAALLVLWVVVARRVRRRRRPIPTSFGWLTTIALFVGVAVLYCAGTLVGLGLRAAGAPLPFGLAGLFVGLVLVVAARLLRRRVNNRYAQSVVKGRW